MLKTLAAQIKEFKRDSILTPVFMILEVLMETLSSNILVLSKKGKVLGISLCPGVEEITELIEDKVGGYVDSLF